MRLSNLGNEVILDEFEEGQDPTKKYFISSLLVVSTLITPKSDFYGKIYTSKRLRRHMLTYYRQYGVKLNADNFITMEPNVPLKVQMNDARCIEVLMIETEDISRNVMFLFRMGNQTTHLYAGVCIELRTLLFNNVFAEWTKCGVTHLYVDVSRASRVDERDPRELNNALDAIEKIVYSNPDYKVILVVPKLGYETFAYFLSKRLPARVAIGGIMSAVLQSLQKTKYFQSNYLDATIAIVHKSFTLEDIKNSHKVRNYIFIQITDKTKQLKDGFYEICWSPSPSAFELQLLATLTHPDRIYAIHHDDATAAPKVPHYLLKLCNNYEEILDDMEEMENVELEIMEEILSVTSTEQNSCETNDCDHLQKLLDTTLCADPQNLVQQWLENGGINNSKKLREAVNRKQDVRTTKKSVPFCVQRPCIKYVEDCDSSQG